MLRWWGKFRGRGSPSSMKSVFGEKLILIMFALNVHLKALFFLVGFNERLHLKNIVFLINGFKRVQME